MKFKVFKQDKKLLLTSCLALLLMTTGSVIYAMPETSTMNHFQTGIVDISLEEFQTVDGKEIAWEDGVNVLPGKTISKIPRITNNGSCCFVRVKLTFRDTDEELEKSIFGMDGWIKENDGYYYYPEELKTDETADIFQGLNIPEDFSQDGEGTDFFLDVDVDAVQSQNFTPDYDSVRPWGDIRILSSKKEGAYDIQSFEKGGSEQFQVEYQGDAKTLIANSADFFTNFPVLMPGDEYEDSAELINSSSDAVNIYFRSEAISDSALLDKVNITIKSNIDGISETVFDGPVRAEELAESKLLGTIPENSQGNLTFALSVPKELNNEYSILNDIVKWTFSTEPVTEAEQVKTGDDQKIGLYLMIAGASLAFGVMIAAAKDTKSQE